MEKSTKNLSLNSVYDKKIFLTGSPKCGKTTIIKKVAERLTITAYGFFTEEIREKGKRVGFSINTLSGKKGILSHINIKKGPKVGKYGVNLNDIDKIAIASMIPKDDKGIIIIDEIGKMECFSKKFIKTVKDILKLPNPILGSVALKGDGLIKEIKGMKQIKLIFVNEENRNSLPDLILNLLQ